MMTGFRAFCRAGKWSAIAALFVFLTLPGVCRAQSAPNRPKLASDRQDAAVTAPAAPDNSSNLSFLNLLTRGGWAMWPLAACSLLGLALLIERGLALRKSEIIPAGFIAGLDRIYRGPADTAAALDYCRKKPSAIARTMAAGIRKLAAAPALAEEALADQGATEVARLRRNLRLLHGISALTPILGLLGTVWGMIRAFEAASLVGLGHPETLTTGIYEALVATMCGLMIAAPVLLFYYIYLGIIDRAILELNDACQAFLERHESARQPSREPALEPQTQTATL